MRFGVLAMVLMAIGLVAVAEDPKKEGNALKGTWTAVSITASGQNPPDDFVKSFQCKFDEKSYVNTATGQMESGDYTVDDKANPRTVDFDIKDGPDKGKKQLGIFKIEDDTLTLVVSQPDSKDRPKSFKADPGLDVIEFVLKRDKP